MESAERDAAMLVLAQPHQYRVCFAVDLAHKLNLVISFIIISLVNANSVAPQIVMVAIGLES